jgi:hypothetical protein
VALAVPVTTLVLPTAVPIAVGAVAIDNTVIHPDIVKACAGIGTPVAAITAEAPPPNTATTHTTP